jgi:adenylate cyclase
MPPLSTEEITNNRAFQLMTERPYPWSGEVYALLLDRLFEAGARLVMFDLMFDQQKEGDSSFHAALDRYRDRVVLAANFDTASPVAQAVTPNDALIPPPQLQDDRIGFASFWADPIDGKVRAVNYHVTNRQLAGLPPHPSQEVYESFSARALAKIGRGNDVPRDFPWPHDSVHGAGRVRASPAL